MLCAGLFGLLMPLAAAVAAARSFSVERELGTLEALVLTLVPRNLLVRKRFCIVIAPWARLTFYALLACLAVNLTGILASRSDVMLDGGVWSYGAAPWSIRWLDFLGKVFVAHSLDASVCVWRMETLPAASVHGFLLSGMRWANDASSFLFAAALAFFLSVRVKSVRKAVTLSFLAAAGALLTILSPDAWWLALSTMLQSRNPDTYLHAYWLVTLALVAARIVLAFKLVSRVADNFDAYILGESLGKERVRTPPCRFRRSSA